jgi:hypothetical protein
VVRLTEAGQAERAELDRDLVRTLLDPLDDAQRDRLVEAVATVERLLTAGLVVKFHGGRPARSSACG